MLVSCICVCHNKPDLTHEAIESIVHQTYSNWEAIVIDSGVLYDAGYYERFPWRNDPRIKLVRSGETEETRRKKAMAPWCFNECLRRGLVRGDLIMYLCDDDVLYPNAFATFVSYCRQHPDARAMYASEDVGLIHPSGWRAVIAERRASGVRGTAGNGTVLDGQVDYLQFCHKAEVLKLFPSAEYWPEEKGSEAHADGIFMERVGERVTIFPIDVKVGQNRRTPSSTYLPSLSGTELEALLDELPGAAPRLGAALALMADPEEREAALWNALHECQRCLERVAGQHQVLQIRLGALRYRIADGLHALCSRVPYARPSIKWLLLTAGRLSRYVARAGARPDDCRTVEAKNDSAAA
jgi:hypothetical protein